MVLTELCKPPGEQQQCAGFFFFEQHSEGWIELANEREEFQDGFVVALDGHELGQKRNCAEVRVLLGWNSLELIYIHELWRQRFEFWTEGAAGNDLVPTLSMHAPEDAIGSQGLG